MNDETRPINIHNMETTTMRKPVNPYLRYMDQEEQELKKAPARHDGLAVAALVFAFLFWPLSIFFGHRSNRETRQAGRSRSVLATVALVISYSGMACLVLFIVAGIAGSH